MIRAALAACALLAACGGAQQHTYRELDQIGRDYQRAQATSQPSAPADACGMAERRDLIGQTAAEIDPARLPEGARTVCLGCMTTTDYVPSRLNLQLDAEGKVASLRCG
jgi:hypothetical protein